MSSRHISNSRDILNHQNGKGSKTRVSDVEAFSKNYDQIDWHRNPHRLPGSPNEFNPLAHEQTR